MAVVLCLIFTANDNDSFVIGILWAIFIQQLVLFVACFISSNELEELLAIALDLISVDSNDLTQFILICFLVSTWFPAYITSCITFGEIDSHFSKDSVCERMIGKIFVNKYLKGQSQFIREHREFFGVGQPFRSDPLPL